MLEKEHHEFGIERANRAQEGAVCRHGERVEPAVDGSPIGSRPPPPVQIHAGDDLFWSRVFEKPRRILDSDHLYGETEFCFWNQRDNGLGGR